MLRNQVGRVIILFMIICTGSVSCRRGMKSLPAEDDRMLTFVFYNVENLYDTFDDPRPGDQEFLPAGKKQWNSTRYRYKITDISKVLKELGGNELPEIIGLCEVENRKVVQELVSHVYLSAGNYKVIHYNDRDPRGIDLALAYRPAEFTVISQKLIPVKNRRGGTMARGILYVTGKAGNGELFHIFVNHWPSRDNDDISREEDRKEMAGALRRITDSLFEKDEKTNIVILGDMNDEPDNESMLKVLGAELPGEYPQSRLVNLMFPALKKGFGTYRFRGDWKMLDNLVVSVSLLDVDGYRVEDDRGFVFSRMWMEFHSGSGVVSPNRTYAGDKYTGGVSDHFPVYFRLVRQK